MLYLYLAGLDVHVRKVIVACHANVYAIKRASSHCLVKSEGYGVSIEVLDYTTKRKLYVNVIRVLKH